MRNRNYIVDTPRNSLIPPAQQKGVSSTSTERNKTVALASVQDGSYSQTLPQRWRSKTDFCELVLSHGASWRNQPSVVVFND